MSDEFPTQEADSRLKVRWWDGKGRPGWLKSELGAKVELNVDRLKARLFHPSQREDVLKAIAVMGENYELAEYDI